MSAARRGLMDPNFRYVRSGETDVAKTFKRIRAQQKAEAETAKAPVNVRSLKKASK